MVAVTDFHPIRSKKKMEDGYGKDIFICVFTLRIAYLPGNVPCNFFRHCTEKNFLRHCTEKNFLVQFL